MNNAGHAVLLLDGVHKVRSHHTIHHTMIATQRDGHHILHHELGLIFYCSPLSSHKPSEGTTVFTTPPTARMQDYTSGFQTSATCGGLMMAENEGMLYMPRLLTVMLPAYIASLSRPYSILLRKQFPLLALADQLLHLLVETQQTRFVDVVQHRSDQAIGH